MQCPHCNQEHPEGSQFCPMTGRKIIMTGVCPKCGNIVDPKWRHCTHCGQKLIQTDDLLKQEARVSNIPRTPITSSGYSKPIRRSPNILWLMIVGGIGVLFILAIVVFNAFLNGLSAEQAPNMTATAWTITPIFSPTPAPTKIPTLTVLLPTVSANDVSLILHDEPLVSECPIAQASTSIVWVEPGPEAGTIAVLGKVPLEYLQVLGLSTAPDLEMVMIPVFTTEGFKGQSPFSFGTKFYGAVTGPVRIAGQDRRNMNGATVVARRPDGSSLSESDIIFGPNPVDCIALMFDLNPPFLADKP